MWDRNELTGFAATGFGTVLGVDVFDPTAIVAGNQDLRVTIRAMRLTIFPTFTFSAAVSQGLVIGLGAYIRRATETIRDPLLPAAADQRADWMYLAYENFSIAAGAQVIIASDTTFQGDNSIFRPRIRAMRKMDQDELVTVCLNAKRLDAGTFVAPTQTRVGMVIDASVLYSRTRR